jgi:hypothetical protein
MPVAWPFVLRSARCLHQEGHDGWLLPPGVACLPHSAGAWHEGDSANAMFQTPAEGAATLGVAIGDDPTHPVHAQREPLLNGQGRCDTVPAVAIPQAHPEGPTTIPTSS